MNAEIRRHACNCVMLYVFWFHSSRYSRTLDLLTEDVTHTLDTFSKTPFSIILRIITLAFPIYIYIIHGNLRIIANKPIYIYCVLSVSDGRLHPAFFASLIKHPYTLKGITSVVKFEDVRVNRGHGYNPSTGVFTAPRKGLYHISCLILGMAGHAVHYQLNKNDALYTKGYSRPGAHTSSTLSVIVEMTKGDRVFIRHRHTSSAQQITGHHHSTFSGYFLQE